MAVIHTSDSALLARWRRSGDPASFGALVERHAAMVRATAARILCDSSTADDVTQDCFARLAQLERFDGRSVGGWLHRAARNRCIDHLRAERRRHERETEYASAGMVAPAPDVQAILNEVDAALDALPQRLREPMVLHYLEGRTHREIARTLGLTRSGVSRRIRHGLEELRAQLGVRNVNVSLAAISAALAVALDSTRNTTLAAGLDVALRKLALAPNPARTPAAFPLAPTSIASATLAAAVLLAAIGWVAVTRLDMRDPSVTAEPLASIPARSVDALAATEPENQTDVPQSDTVAVVSDAPSLEITSPTQIHGTVTDDAGNAVEGARVVLFHNTNDWGLDDRVVEEATTDSAGEFKFNSMPAYLKSHAADEELDQYTVFVEHSAHAYGWANLRRGSELDPVTVELDKPHGGSVLVVDHVNDAPIEGAVVWAYAVGDRYETTPQYRDRVFVHSAPGVFDATTNAAGIAFFPNLPDAKVSFRVTKTGYATGYAFAEGRTARLTRGANVTGRISDENDSPVVGATVQLGAYLWMHLYFKSRTDANGEFVFEDLPAEGWDKSPWEAGTTGSGNYTVTVSADRAWVPNSFIGLAQGKTTQLELKAQTGVRVRCRVVTEITRQPVAGALVQLFRSDFETDPVGYTDARGEVVFVTAPAPIGCIVRAPPEGTYWSRDVWEAWMPDISKIPFHRVQGPETTITVTCPEIAGRLVTLRGRVRVPHGLSHADLRVCVSSEEGLTLPGRSQRDAYFQGTAVESDGSYTVHGVPEGVRIHVYCDSRDQRYGGVFTTVTPGGGQPHAVPQFDLMRAQSVDYVIEADTLEETLARELNVRLIVSGDEPRCGAAGRSVKADQNGIFHIPNVLPGHTYRIVDWESSGEGETPVDVTEVLVPLR